MQRYTIFFITVNVLHVSGGFSTYLQEQALIILVLNNTVSVFLYLSHGGKVPVEEDRIYKLRIKLM